MLMMTTAEIIKLTTTTTTTPTRRMQHSCGLNLHRLFVVGLLLSLSSMCGGDEMFPDLDRDVTGLIGGAEEFSNHIIELFNVITGTGIYQRSDLKVVKRSSFDVRLMLDGIKEKMEEVMNQKARAVEELKKSAEQAMKNYGPYKNDIDFEEVSYFNAKKVVIQSDIAPLNNKTQEAIIDTINYLPTKPTWDDFKTPPNRPMLNTNTSSIHVPTNIYDKSMKILNGVKWTKSMTKQFVSNKKKDSQLTWQYFCSSDGFYRIFPGMQWPRDADKVDTFDCRIRQWYIQAATSPKNIIILLDASGSMKGLRLSIAKSTVFTILDTLSDEDYFNVIKFSDEPKYVVDCFNGTLMPATVDNIRRMKGLIEDLEAKKFADFEKALVTAFDLFKREHHLNHKKRICNRAIMLITDGAPDNFDYIFKDFNWPNKTVRVFTFLIGKEVQDNRQARWMACANKGKFTHISTRADVQENVQKYVKVLSRPLAIHKASHQVWTPVYLDYVTLQAPIQARPGKHTQLEVDYEDKFKFQGLGLVMSVSMPVFDKRTPDRVGPNEEDPTRNLLGVVGADLRINELMKLLPTYELGANGYAFAITNHGYILFHPDYTPFYREREATMYKLIPRPKYNSVELSEVERPAATLTMNEHREHPLSYFLLRSDTGDIVFNVVTHIDNMKYVENRENFYNFVEISNAFRLVFAFPNSYGFNYITTEETPEQTYAQLGDDYTGTTVEYSHWIYCKSLRSGGYQALMAGPPFMYLSNKDVLFKKCDKTHAQHILKDHVITRMYAKVWLGLESNRLRHTYRNQYVKEYDSHCYSLSGKDKLICFLGKHLNVYGIDILWIGTRSGITRYIRTNMNQTDPQVLKMFSHWEQHYIETVKSPYYQRTVSLWDAGYKYVFAGPVNSVQKEFEFNNSYVTMSHVEAVGSDPKLQSPAGVVAFYMKYSAFYQMFVNYTFTCQQDYCSYTCNDTDHFNCYIIDNNGYVLASNNQDMNGTSLFLGEHDPYLMRALVDDNIFEEIELTDFQSTCESRILSGQDNASNFIINPLQFISKILVWFLTEIVIFLSQLTVMTWNGISGVMGLETSDDMGDEKECGQWIPEATARYLFCGFVINSATGERKAASFITQRRSCELMVTRYNLNLEVVKQRKFKSSIAQCARMCQENLPSYTLKRLNLSNLFFVVSDANCQCDVNTSSPSPSSSTFSPSSQSSQYEDEDEEEENYRKAKDRYKFSMKPIERTYLENEQCQRLRNLSEELKRVDKTRLSNTLCLDSSIEEDTPCSYSPSLTQPRCPQVYIVLALFVTSVFRRILWIDNTSLR